MLIVADVLNVSSVYVLLFIYHLFKWSASYQAIAEETQHFHSHLEALVNMFLDCGSKTENPHTHEKYMQTPHEKHLWVLFWTELAVREYEDVSLAPHINENKIESHVL